jgi:hypothetical protein
MSFFPGKDPAPGDARAADAIDLVLGRRSFVPARASTCARIPTSGSPP